MPKKGSKIRRLKWHEAAEIRMMLGRGAPVSELAKQWNVKPRVIEQIDAGLIYVHKHAAPVADPEARIRTINMSEKTARGISLLAAHHGVTVQEAIDTTMENAVREHLSALAAEWVSEP